MLQRFIRQVGSNLAQELQLALHQEGFLQKEYKMKEREPEWEGEKQQGEAAKQEEEGMEKIHY